MTFSVLGIDTQTGQRIELPKTSRLQGLYIIGAPGMGKTGLVENLIVEDMKQGLGVCLLDPHGDLTQAVLSRVPDHREQDVILLDLLDTAYPFGLNLYQCDDPTDSKKVSYTRAQVMHIFTKLWGDESGNLGVRIEQYLRNSATTLIEKGYTMAELPLLFQNKYARSVLTANLASPQTRSFWKGYNELKPDDQQQRYDSTLNRADAFLSDEIIYNIVGQQSTTINFRHIMDGRKILLVKLDARLEEMTNLIGALIIAQLLNAAYSRSDLPVNKRRQFHIYADEFQRFATEDFATLLTEARKFGVAVTIAHQFRNQLDSLNRSATLNVTNLVVFRIIHKDADEIAGQFDCTPIRTKKVQKMRTEPVYKEWDEEVWIDDEAKQRFDEAELLLREAEKRRHSVSSILYSIGKAITTSFDSGEYSVESNIEWILQRLINGGNAPLLRNWDQLFNPVKDYFYYDIQRSPRGQLTRSGLVQVKRVVADTDEEGIPTEFRYHEGYILKPEAAAHYNCALSVALGKIYGEFTPDNLKELRQEVTDVLKPLYETAIFWFEAYSVNSEETAKFAATRPEIGKERLDKDWANTRYWEVTPFPQAVSWLRQKVRSLRAEEAEHQTQINKIQQAMELLTQQFKTTVHHKDYIGEKPSKGYPNEREVQWYDYTEELDQTHAQRQNEIANELSNLPMFTARVKIATIAPEEKLIEHSIKTLDPKQHPDKPLFGQALQERIERIKEQNRTPDQFGHVYCRPKKEVEEEVRIRQEQCIQPPEEPPDAIYRRQQR